ncbi:hypothetical protein SprV_1002851800 [Sparganum proliferum]
MDYVRVESSPFRHIDCEILSCYLKVPNHPRLHIALVYRPPSQRTDADDALLTEVKEICRSKYIMLLGDFNCPDIEWDLMHCSRSENSFEQKFMQLITTEFLTQHVKVDTRFRDGQQSSCLDLIITRDDSCILGLESHTPLGRSDHSVLVWEYSHFPVPEIRAAEERNIWKGDYTRMKNLLQKVNWDAAQGPDPESDWLFFKNIMQHLVESCCPLKRKARTSRPEWVTSETKKNLKLKRRLWKKYAKCQQPEHFVDFKKTEEYMSEFVEEATGTI